MDLPRADWWGDRDGLNIRDRDGQLLLVVEHVFRLDGEMFDTSAGLFDAKAKRDRHSRHSEERKRNAASFVHLEPQAVQ